MMSCDERNELLRDASSLAYTAIRFSGLYKELSSAEWERVSQRIGAGLVAYLEQAIDERFTAIEIAKESSNAL